MSRSGVSASSLQRGSELKFSHNQGDLLIGAAARKAERTPVLSRYGVVKEGFASMPVRHFHMPGYSLTPQGLQGS